VVCTSGLPKVGTSCTHVWFRNVVLSWFDSSRLRTSVLRLILGFDTNRILIALYDTCNQDDCTFWGAL
jgi:hypothetical protein